MYALNWDAKNPDEIWKEKGQDIAKGLFSAGMSLMKKSGPKESLFATGLKAAQAFGSTVKSG